jgi:MraZ protein
MCAKVVNFPTTDFLLTGFFVKEADKMLASMLTGTYTQSMDVKGRMAFPARLREIIGEKFIVTKGIGGCLFVYSMENFAEKAEKLKALPMAQGLRLQRSFMANAVEVEADKQGRILVPAILRTIAALEKEIVVVGVSDHCEIWNPEKWAELNASVTDEMLMEALEGSDF